MNQEIFLKLRPAAAKYFHVDAEVITPETNLTADLGADSLDVVEFIMHVEDMFQVKFQGEQGQAPNTIHEIVAALEEMLLVAKTTS